ncbi:class I SAM-dependent methyltransferase [Telmatocola sphagniphila]|uniref:Class I SAM-dependent methyltransferase n=1 Tax=Telmatocola sphagniphila TaxID=1123043 RepID=A0A8E6B909_9BACT|nr:class I SAM-dependent methyltransferase [Telmatocola sphagniphila]QVL33629.1 class I SAM-dependent methyltransferase [Telmatocola sphagniphila]
MEPANDFEDDPYPDSDRDTREKYAYELAMSETWRRFSNRHRKSDLEPFSLPWFDSVNEKRYIRHASWIPRLFEFARHKGERVLLYGTGLGSDAIQYAKNGAKLTVCSTDKVHLHWTRKNLDLHKLSATMQFCRPTELAIASDSVDIVTLSFFNEVPEPLAHILDEAWRVLRPGGKIIAVVPARYGAGFWRKVLCFWESWFKSSRNSPKANPTYRGTDLKKSLENFEVRRITKRHLRRSDMPSFLRWAYFPVLERLFGQIFVIKAIKPIRAALADMQAA